MRGMTAAELSELRMFHDHEPLGELRGDARAGMIAATIANVNRSKDSEPYHPIDFMPYSKKPATEPVLLDPEAQSKLILSALFGKHDDEATP
ncbi:MAG: DUF4035 domain-containing protein [Sulfuriferula sp.]